MLKMGMIGSHILNWANSGTLKNFKIRYLAPANENDVLTFKGKIVKKYQQNNEEIIEISILTETQEKTITRQVSAIISFSA